MLSTFEAMKGLLSTIALMVMALLAVGYSTVTRAFTRPVMAQAAVGVLFGGPATVAIVAMLARFT